MFPLVIPLCTRVPTTNLTMSSRCSSTNSNTRLSLYFPLQLKGRALWDAVVGSSSLSPASSQSSSSPSPSGSVWRWVKNATRAQTTVSFAACFDVSSTFWGFSCLCRRSFRSTSAPSSSGWAASQTEKLKDQVDTWAHVYFLVKKASFVLFYLFLMVMFVLFTGIFFILPCTDSFVKVDLRTVSFDIPPQEVEQHWTVTYVK